MIERRVQGFRQIRLLTVITPPQSQAARVRREMRGGKVVTVISGLDPVASDLSALLKQFRTSVGAGGTVKVGTIEIQDDHRAALIDCLRTLGYPAKAAGGGDRCRS